MIFHLLIAPFLLGGAISPTPTPTPGVLSINQLDAQTNSTDTTAYTTDSFTPTASSLLVIACTTIRNISSDPGLVTITDSDGTLTWFRIIDYQNITTGSSHSRLALYAAAVPASPSAMTITSTYGVANLGCIQQVFEVLQSDVAHGVTQSFVQTVIATINSSGASAPLTLAAAHNANNRSLQVTMHWANEATTPATGWTEIGDANQPSPAIALETQWKSSAFDTAPTATWSTTSNFGAIAVEIKAQ